ncbi:MAG: HNH endonuclease [Bacteroidales bacterium]|nr:HNH endonuclease [Bacteroidales bacterium]
MNESDYNSKRWDRIRKVILQRDDYLDQIEKRFGRRVEATTVHHIFPREYFPQWGYEPWNLISLSNKTHNQMHNREDHKLTNEGWKLLEKTARENGIHIPDGMKSAIVSQNFH